MMGNAALPPTAPATYSVARIRQLARRVGAVPPAPLFMVPLEHLGLDAACAPERVAAANPDLAVILLWSERPPYVILDGVPRAHCARAQKRLGVPALFITPDELQQARVSAAPMDAASVTSVTQ